MFILIDIYTNYLYILLSLNKKWFKYKKIMVNWKIIFLKKEWIRFQTNWIQIFFKKKYKINSQKYNKQILKKIKIIFGYFKTNKKYKNNNWNIKEIH